MIDLNLLHQSYLQPLESAVVLLLTELRRRALARQGSEESAPSQGGDRSDEVIAEARERARRLGEMRTEFERLVSGT